MISENLKSLSTLSVMENINLTAVPPALFCPQQSVLAQESVGTVYLWELRVSEEPRVTWGIEAADTRIRPSDALLGLTAYLL